MERIRVGIVGLGGNTRLRHVPGLRACEAVELVGVVNSSPQSTESVALEFGIPQRYSSWQELVADPQIDAVVIGTWPYLHCPITLAALEGGKHVLTEARMAMNAHEARQMLVASQKRPDLVTQIVPSPFGLYGHRVVKELLASGYLGELREVVALSTSSMFADANSPLHWRQDASLSGVNILALGILHETLCRWVPAPIRVLAQTGLYTENRMPPIRNVQEGTAGSSRATPLPVDIPDSVHVLSELPQGARGIYHLSGAIYFGPSMQIHLYGSAGTIKYVSDPAEKIYAARRGEKELREVPVPPGKAGGWRVESDFIDAIRGKCRIEFTDFETGIGYMTFTEAVRRSAVEGRHVDCHAVA